MKVDPLINNNLSQVLATKLEEMILERKIKPGEKLPSESKLCELFGVSRTIVREALTCLRERDLIDIKPGIGGIVVKPKGRSLGAMVQRLINLTDVSYKDVYDMRIVLETAACKLAALNRTEEDIEQLSTILKKMESSLGQKQWSMYEMEFHLTIAKLSKNNLYPIIIDQIADILEDFFERSKREESFKDHQEILKAIKSGDPEKAYSTMLKHLSFDLNSEYYKALTEA